MKHSLFASVLLAFALAPPAQAGCLDGQTLSSSIIAKIRGFYVLADNNGPGDSNDPNQMWVIIDKATCASSGADTTLGANTKAVYYLQMNPKDKVLMAHLMSAQSSGTPVNFRLKPTTPNADGYNEIAYVVSPSSATSQ